MKRPSWVFFFRLTSLLVYNVITDTLRLKRKVGEELHTQDDYLFWRLAHFLITNQDYRLIQITGNEQELWLENVSNKNAKLIRILRKDLDWGNWMQRDIEAAAAIGERFRRRYIHGELHVLNVYVTPFPPVDEYEFRIGKPFLLEEGKKTSVTSLLILSNQLSLSLEKLSGILGCQIPIDLSGVYDEQDILALKKQTLTYTITKAKEEKSIFENGKPFFTYIFLIVIVSIFLLMEVFGGSTNTRTLIRFGAKFNPLIIEGEWWRFITPVFLHIGFLHLLMNSFALYYMGPLVERIYGNFRFLLIFLFAGFSGVLASFSFSPVLSAGASGAIFGCFGAMLYFGMIYPKLFFRTIGMNILVVIGINLLFGFTFQGVDNAGHIGGLIGGFLASGILHFPKGKKPILQILFLVISSLAVFGLLNFGFGESTRAIDSRSSYTLAQSYVESEDYERAYNVLKEAHGKGSESAELLLLLSYVEIKKGMTSEAKEHLHEVITLNSDFHEAYYYLAWVYVNEYDLEKAKENAEKAVKMEPGKLEYREMLKKINDYISEDLNQI